MPLGIKNPGIILKSIRIWIHSVERAIHETLSNIKDEGRTAQTIYGFLIDRKRIIR